VLGVGQTEGHWRGGSLARLNPRENLASAEADQGLTWRAIIRQSPVLVLPSRSMQTGSPTCPLPAVHTGFPLTRTLNAFMRCFPAVPLPPERRAVYPPCRPAKTVSRPTIGTAPEHRLLTSRPRRPVVKRNLCRLNPLACAQTAWENHLQES